MWCHRYLLCSPYFKNIRNRSPQLFQSTASTVMPASVTIPSQNSNWIEEIPTSAPISELKNVLNVNNCIFKDGYSCFSVQCVNCGPEKRGQVFINKITGFCLCVDCQEVGEWVDFNSKVIMMNHSETECKMSSSVITKKKPQSKKLDMITDLKERWNDLKQTLQPVASLPPSEIERVVSLFGLNITGGQKILLDLDTVYDEVKQSLYFPLSNGRKRIVGIKELALNGHESCIPVKKCPGFLRFMPRTSKKCDSVILVLRIKDLLALSIMKHNYHVICLPHGANALPQEILPLLEKYTKIVLWFGADESGAARLFANKLKDERCYLIRLTDKPGSLVENVQEVNISNILKNAHPMKNKYVTTFANLRDEVFQGITNTDQSQGIKWTRFPHLNELLRGHRRGELTILTGPTGCGKTTFLSEYSLDLAMQGVSTLWGSFEIRNQRLATTMLQQFAMEPLNENLDKFESWATSFEKLPVYFLKFHGQQSIELVMEVVEQATYVHDIRHLVIDNLQFMLGLSSSDQNMDRFYKQDKVVAAFRTFATMHDCHVTMIIHPRKERDSEDLSISSLFGTAKASQEADNIMIIQKKMLESLRIKKYLQVVKNRFTGDLGIMPLNFTKSALSFGIKYQKNKS